jgi:hypothetical protein
MRTNSTDPAEHARLRAAAARGGQRGAETRRAKRDARLAREAAQRLIGGGLDQLAADVRASLAQALRAS